MADLKFRLTSKFGELSPVRDFEPHHGIDFAMPEGTTLRSIGRGVVDRVYDGTDAIGRGVSVKLDDGTRAIYGHMSGVNVRPGQSVTEGQTLGLSGDTGLSTGPHLHFALRDSSSGEWVDPSPIAEQVASISGHIQPGVLTKLFNSTGERHPGLLWSPTNGIREWAADTTTEIILGIFDALTDLLMGVTLVGSAVLILLKVAGWRDGGRWAGVLLVVNVLLRIIPKGG
jgi:murein DD-endopeptidase MepM/ murein hydrolase activator NlpD